MVALHKIQPGNGSDMFFLQPLCPHNAQISAELSGDNVYLWIILHLQVTHHHQHSVSNCHFPKLHRNSFIGNFLSNYAISERKRITPT